MEKLEQLLKEANLLEVEAGVCRLPFLVRGELVVPERVERSEIAAAFAAEVERSGKRGRDVTYVKMEKVQVVREPLVDREASRFTDGWLYQVMPRLSPSEVCEPDPTKLAPTLYNLPVKEVISYLGEVGRLFAPDGFLARKGIELSRFSSELPDDFIRGAFFSIPMLFSEKMATEMIDNELSFGGIAGRKFLDGWTKVKTEGYPGISMVLANRVAGVSGGLRAFAARAVGWMKFGVPLPDDIASIMPTQGYSVQTRAMPTRQLHVTAGNSPLVPVMSCFRALVTKGYGVIKAPYGATIPGALLALALYTANPDHPLTRNTSIVYWKGGDREVEEFLFLPTFFDRLVVWGSPEAVESIRARPIPIKPGFFNPRYALSFIGLGSEEGEDLDAVAARAAIDTMIWNQKACISSLVHYVEGDEARALAYCEALSRALAKWDEEIPNLVPPHLAGQIKRLKRGKFMTARWFTNGAPGKPQSHVIYMPGEFNLLDHPFSRTVIVRRLDSLEKALGLLHPAVSAVGVHPEPRRLALRDLITARGVSCVFPLGEGEKLYAGIPHDGMRVLSELVEWVNG